MSTPSPFFSTKTFPKKQTRGNDYKNPSLPLCVDLDGTLIETDVTWETLRLWVCASPMRLLKLPLLLWKGRACLKKQLAQEAPVDVTNLPYNEELISLLRDYRGSHQHPLLLVTAADKSIGMAVAHHLGIFDDVVGSDGSVNLRSRAKAKALTDLFGDKGFSYVGNSKDDLAVWEKACSGMGVGITPKVEDLIWRRGLAVRILSRRSSGIREGLSLLQKTPWSWSFFLGAGCLIKGSWGRAAFLEWIVLLLAGVVGGLLPIIVRKEHFPGDISDSPSFKPKAYPLSFVFSFLGASSLGICLIIPFLPLGGWLIGSIYGLNAYASAVCGGHMIRFVLALVALLGGLAL